MAFTLPTFNLVANIWRFGNATTNPPDVVANCNLCRGERAAVARPIDTSLVNTWGEMWLLLPKATDIRDGKAAAGADTVEVPAASGRFYSVQWVDDAGSGFANEHRFAAILGTTPWPVPFPAPGGGGGGFAGTFINGSFDPAPDLSNTKSFPAPAGPVYCVVFQSCQIVDPPVLTVAGIGVVAPMQLGPFITVGGDFGTLAFYTWVHPGGALSYALTTLGGNLQQSYVNVYVGSLVALDQVGTSSGAGASMAIALGAPTTGATDIVIGVFLVTPPDGPYNAPFSWTQAAPLTPGSMVISGQQYDLATFFSTQTVGFPSLTVAQSGGTPSPWIGYLLALK